MSVGGALPPINLFKGDGGPLDRDICFKLISHPSISRVVSELTAVKLDPTGANFEFLNARGVISDEEETVAIDDGTTPVAIDETLLELLLLFK